MPFIGQQPITGAYHKLDSITTSATATYNLQLNGGAYYPTSANHLLVSLNGVMQAPQDSFTVSGSQITFASALTSSDSIDFIMALGDVLDIGVPSDGAVNTSQLANSAVTSAKLGTGAAQANISAGTITASQLASTLDLSGKTLTLPTVVHASGRLASSHTLANGGWDRVENFTDELVDTDNAFDGNTFTVPSGKGGTYLLTSHLEFWFQNVGRDPTSVAMRFYKNGSGLYYYSRQFYNSTAAWTISGIGASITEVYQLSAGDTIEVYAYQENSGSGSITIENGAQSMFSITRIGD